MDPYTCATLPHNGKFCMILILTNNITLHILWASLLIPTGILGTISVSLEQKTIVSFWFKRGKSGSSSTLPMCFTLISDCCGYSGKRTAAEAVGCQWPIGILVRKRGAPKHHLSLDNNRTRRIYLPTSQWTVLHYTNFVFESKGENKLSHQGI